MKKQRGYTAIERFQLFIAVVFFVGCGGWIANIYKLIHTDSGVTTGMVIARCAGVIVAPLGAVLGFF